MLLSGYRPRIIGVSTAHGSSSQRIPPDMRIFLLTSTLSVEREGHRGTDA